MAFFRPNFNLELSYYTKRNIIRCTVYTYVEVNYLHISAIYFDLNTFFEAKI